MQSSGVTVFDLETTGLSPSYGDRITEIGAIKLVGNKLCGVLQTLVNPGRKIPDKIVEITGITNEMVADKPTIGQVLPLLLILSVTTFLRLTTRNSMPLFCATS